MIASEKKSLQKWPVVALFRQSDGCIADLRRWHSRYLVGELNEEQCGKLDAHLLHCRRCENHWDALTLVRADSFPLAPSEASTELDVSSA